MLLLNKQLGKKLIGLSLSLSLMFSGSLVLKPHVVQAATVSSSSYAVSIISTGKRYLGVPYKYGAKAGSTRAFDCSSFVQYIFKRHGIYLPRSSKQQSRVGSYVSKRNLRVGDLVFFYSPTHHVGVYMGNGRVLHTFGRGGVTISNINHGWWKNHYTTARRVI